MTIDSQYPRAVKAIRAAIEHAEQEQLTGHLKTHEIKMHYHATQAIHDDLCQDSMLLHLSHVAAESIMALELKLKEMGDD